MRVAVLVVALFAIGVGIVGIVSPARLTAARWQVMASPGAFLLAGALRVAMAFTLIVFAPRSRAPKLLRLLGVVMCLQGVVPQLLGIERGRVILEQEGKVRTEFLRVGAVVALATGCFIAFVATPRPRSTSAV